jgi:phosphatidylglycerophosphatase A
LTTSEPGRYKADSAGAIRPDLAFLLRRPEHFLALGFGSGLSRMAPGTMGTVAALPLFGLLMLVPGPVHHAIIALLFVLGIRLCSVTGRNLGVADHGSIVWDEIVAMLLVLEFAPLAWQWWLAAFLLFRLFDIWKPYPIRWFDMRLKGGFGVMFDDLLAAVYAIVSLEALQWIMLHF